MQEILHPDQARYRAQLQTYARILLLLGERPIQLGLYFPHLQPWHDSACPQPYPL